jgi:glycerol-3-phosphate acyltransferase PlsY
MSPWIIMELKDFGVAALALLLGSIPFGLLLTRAAGLGDIRAIGSGNIGATNVLRTGRRGLALATLLLDAGKGAAAVQMAPLVFGSTIWMPLAAVAAVVGHCFTPWLGFKGGKGVATGLGVLLALDWRIGVISCATWLLVALTTRMSSAGALAAFLISPATAWWFLPPFWWIAPWAVALLVFYRHEANIKRILEGTEPKIGK